jgi:hypothetical protein
VRKTGEGGGGKKGDGVKKGEGDGGKKGEGEGVVLLLEEGRYTFALDNGAVLRVWISPFTPSMAREEVNMGVSVPRWERA